MLSTKFLILALASLAFSQPPPNQHLNGLVPQKRHEKDQHQNKDQIGHFEAETKQVTKNPLHTVSSTI